MAGRALESGKGTLRPIVAKVSVICNTTYVQTMLAVAKIFLANKIYLAMFQSKKQARTLIGAL
ncbi:MAG: hypothetical protein ABIO19_13930 [Burkholderiaceae bacterium]